MGFFIPRPEESAQEGFVHDFFMSRALELARRGRYTCRPNPMVGAVLAEDGKIIAEGFHRVFGGAHAERDALSCLPPQKSLKGCTLYVTLEPCCHRGKTPPCTELLIERGLGALVVGSRDPNPLVGGKGIALLKEAGIGVTEGVLQGECQALNEIFFKYITQKTPFVILKGACTLDGKIAANSGHSQWVSCEESRLHAQGLRAHCMGILAGIGTVLADSPRLTCRLAEAPSPLRIVADSHLRIPLDAPILREQEKSPTLIACLEGADPQKKLALEAKGIGLIPCPEREGHIDLKFLFAQLGRRGIDSVLVEGGGAINASLLQGGLADKILLYLAPRILGSGASFVQGPPTRSMDEAFNFNFGETRKIGSDLFIEAYPPKEAQYVYGNN